MLRDLKEVWRQSNGTMLVTLGVAVTYAVLVTVLPTWWSACFVVVSLATFMTGYYTGQTSVYRERLKELEQEGELVRQMFTEALMQAPSAADRPHLH